MKRISLIALILFITFLFANILICAIAFSSPHYNVTTDFGKAKDFFPSEEVVLIVDFSESMNEYLGEKKKIDIAMENLSAILPMISPEVKVGLRVYGHKNGFTVYQACTASELLVPPAKRSATDISNSLYSLSPKGVTPITYSLKKSIEMDFGNFRGTKHIVLISDGKENCDESPCQFAINLMQTRSDIVIDVIALGIDDPEAIAQLKCAALTTNGKFYKSNTSAQLLDSLNRSLKGYKEVQGEVILK